MQHKLSFTSDGLKLSGVLHVPEQWRAGERLPCFIVLHGFVGTKDEESGKWSNPKAIYRAKDAVPSLPEPRAGWRIMDEKLPLNSIRFGGKSVAKKYLHWSLEGQAEIPHLTPQDDDGPAF